jgi:Flp pilus assembly pilin Flp
VPRGRGRGGPGRPGSWERQPSPTMDPDHQVIRHSQIPIVWFWRPAGLEGGTNFGRQRSMAVIHQFLAALRRDEDGQGLAEYALILALIAIVAIIALIFLGQQVSGILSTVGQSV